MQSKDYELQKEYYKEVNSLRALAVIIVVFFHFNSICFNGGFIRVDIFLVISGYFITKLILEDSLITIENNHLIPIATMKVFIKLTENLRAEFENSNQIINNSKKI